VRAFQIRKSLVITVRKRFADYSLKRLIELKTSNIFAIATVRTFSLFCQHNREEMQKNSEFHVFVGVQNFEPLRI